MNLKNFCLAAGFLVPLISCSPKDEKLIRPESISKIKIESSFAEDQIKLSFIAFDKQAEAFHFLKAVFNKDYAIQNKLNVEVISDDLVKSVKRITSADIRNENEKYLQVSQTDLVITISRDEAKNIIEVSLKDNASGKSNLQLFSKENGHLVETPTLLVTNKSKHMIFTAGTAGTYNLETDSVDLLRTQNKKNPNEIFTDFSAVTTQSTFIWDGKESAFNDKIKLSALSLSHIKTSPGKSEIFLNSESVSNLIIHLDRCVAWDGEVSFFAEKSKGGRLIRKFSLDLNDSSIQVPGQTTSFSALDCSVRPVVDMRKWQ